jgi:hypothetical protein
MKAEELAEVDAAREKLKEAKIDSADNGDLIVSIVVVFLSLSSFFVYDIVMLALRRLNSYYLFKTTDAIWIFRESARTPCVHLYRTLLYEEYE